MGLVNMRHNVFSCILAAAILPWCSTQVHLTVHWSHRNGTRLELSAERFAHLAEIERAEPSISKRNAVKDWNYLWYMGTVYYDIDARTADFRLLQILSPAFQFFHKYTCIRWKRRIPGDSHKDYVMFSMPYGGARLCNSAVGRQTGRQFINLDSECVKSLAEVLHQMTHALGFYHMHTRLDRDKYIEVLPQNAAPQNRKFFDMESAAVSDSMGFPYEHKSLMHFNGFKYSKGFNPTIKSRVPGVLLGNNRALTVQDITMINGLYTMCKLSCRFANGHCQHECYDKSPGQVTCSCLQGYRLNSDGKTCYDNDECAEFNGGCDHSCTKHGAWYKCECRPGFTLDKNGYSCRANNLCQDGTLKCEHECQYNKCGCRVGYKLNRDGLACDDVNECSTFNGRCQELCFNTLGSFRCGCRGGQFLSNDGKSCTDITCTKPTDVANAAVKCTNKDMVDGTLCRYSCGRGYKLTGAPVLTCSMGTWNVLAPVCKVASRCQLDNGGCEQKCWANTWDDVQCSCRVGYKLHTNGVNCTDIEPPTITNCPSDIYTNTVPSKSFASVTWDLPQFYDNVEAKIVSGPVMQDKIGGVFDIGAHSVDYVIKDTAGTKAYCSFKIKVNDIEPPDMFNCPKEQIYQVAPIQKYIEASWDDPSFWDNSEKPVKVTTDLPKNRRLQPRSQSIHYIASDLSGNSVVCTVKVTVVVQEANCDTFPFKLVGGRVQCDKFVFGTQCRPTCDNNYDLTRDGIASAYGCSDKTWHPEPKAMHCPEIQSPIRQARLYYQLNYKYDCSHLPWKSSQKVANATAYKYRDVLCPTQLDKCDLSVEIECAKDHVVIRVYTTESLRPPITGRYFRRLRDNVIKHQQGLFFFMPIGRTVLSAQKGPNGVKAEPKIDFACKKGAVKDDVLLKCYSKP